LLTGPWSEGVRLDAGSERRGLTHSPRPIPKGAYELRVETEEAQAQEGRGEGPATPITGVSTAVVPDAGEEAGQVLVLRERFERGAEIVYRHEPREVRCVRCAERDPESKGYRPSIRWERKHRVSR
jgi:hypothetical protein